VAVLVGIAAIALGLDSGALTRLREGAVSQEAWSQ